jgi:SulP family sulfate permease
VYRRYKANAKILLSYVSLRPFSALRERLSAGYSLADLKSDIMAGFIVSVIAIPLAMALAIASGVAPQYGLYTAVIAGFIVPLFGGSRFQVTGPTAAFVVILVPIVHKFGFAGLLVAGFMAGIILILMGVMRMGQLIQFIPYPVTTGFTAGIALVIATIQLKDFFGLEMAHMPEKYFDRVTALIHAAPTFSPVELGIGVLTLALLILWPKVNKRVPAPLVALTVATGVAIILQNVFPDITIATIGNHFSSSFNGITVPGIPQALPAFHLPWTFPGSGGTAFVLNWHTIESLIPSAFAIALLGAIESLLSAVVADGMGQTRHDPDAELIALGTGNLICPFFGAIPATGAIARTAANIRFGAKSPIAAMMHAIFILLSILLFAPAISHLPMASLAALLILVAYNMSELRHFKHILRVGPRSDGITLLLCFSLTVAFDMVIAVSVGIVLAALLFMRRMALVTTGRIVPESQRSHFTQALPKGVVLYEISGPLFFGAVENAIDEIEHIGDDVRVVIFLMQGVQAMDVSGLVAFESAVQEIIDNGQYAILTEVRPQPMHLIRKSNLGKNTEKIKFCKTIEDAVECANSLFPCTT